MNLKGMVLAGGQSRRFGTDKAMAKIGDCTLIEKAVTLLKEIDSEPLVMTNASRDYSFLNCRVEKDIIPEKGPLGGIYTACGLYPETSLLVITCDMPNISVDALRRLADAHDRNRMITLFRVSKDRLQPFPGVYETSLRSSIMRMIQAQELSMQGFIRSISDAQMIPCEFSPREFQNVNESNDLIRL